LGLLILSGILVFGFIIAFIQHVVNKKEFKKRKIKKPRNVSSMLSDQSPLRTLLRDSKKSTN
jgi:hypothetical protein